MKRIALENITQDHLGDEIVFVEELEGFYYDRDDNVSPDKSFPAGTTGVLESVYNSLTNNMVATIYIDDDHGNPRPWEFAVDEETEFDFTNLEG